MTIRDIKQHVPFEFIDLKTHDTTDIKHISIFDYEDYFSICNKTVYDNWRIYDDLCGCLVLDCEVDL